MAKLTKKQRKGLRSSEYALPRERRFPIHDRTHQRAAISGATRSLRAGNITPAQHRAIQAKARQRLYH